MFCYQSYLTQNMFATAATKFSGFQCSNVTCENILINGKMGLVGALLKDKGERGQKLTYSDVSQDEINSFRDSCHIAKISSCEARY